MTIIDCLKDAIASYEDRLSALEEEKEWRGREEYREMKGHYGVLLDNAKKALSLSLS